jgi:hypothetical protein
MHQSSTEELIYNISEETYKSCRYKGLILFSKKRIECLLDESFHNTGTFSFTKTGQKNISVSSFSLPILLVLSFRKFVLISEILKSTEEISTTSHCYWHGEAEFHRICV